MVNCLHPATQTRHIHWLAWTSASCGTLNYQWLAGHIPISSQPNPTKPNHWWFYGWWDCDWEEKLCLYPPTAIFHCRYPFPVTSKPSLVSASAFPWISRRQHSAMYIAISSMVQLPHYTEPDHHTEPDGCCAKLVPTWPLGLCISKSNGSISTRTPPENWTPNYCIHAIMMIARKLLWWSSTSRSSSISISIGKVEKGRYIFISANRLK